VVLVQVVLGLATWVANYATPWIELTPWLARYTVQGKGFWESMIVTGHQATGSLLIVFSLWQVCRAFRRLHHRNFETQMKTIDKTQYPLETIRQPQPKAFEVASE